MAQRAAEKVKCAESSSSVTTARPTNTNDTPIHNFVNDDADDNCVDDANDFDFNDDSDLRSSDSLDTSDVSEGSTNSVTDSGPSDLDRTKTFSKKKDT